MNDQARLDHLDEDEAFDLGRRVNPGYTREQFEADWNTFVELKTAVLRARALS